MPDRRHLYTFVCTCRNMHAKIGNLGLTVLVCIGLYTFVVQNMVIWQEWSHLHTFVYGCRHMHAKIVNLGLTVLVCIGLYTFVHICINWWDMCQGTMGVIFTSFVSICIDFQVCLNCHWKNYHILTTWNTPIIGTFFLLIKGTLHNLGLNELRLLILVENVILIS